jgi:hypothetical protein
MNFNRILKRRKFIGRLLFAIGKTPDFSTDLSGQTTSGYGRTSDVGYFKYPVYKITILLSKFDEISR